MQKKSQTALAFSLCTGYSVFMQAKKHPLKTLRIDPGIHSRLREHCKRNALKVNALAGAVLDGWLAGRFFVPGTLHESNAPYPGTLSGPWTGTSARPASNGEE